MTDFKKLKVVELRAELAARNLPQDGKKDELIERLEEYEFQHAEPEAMEVVDEVSEAQSPDTEKPIIHTPVQQSSHITASVQSVAISPIPVPSIPSADSSPEPASTDLQAIEEEKRRQRALRFGLDTSATPAVNIEVTINRLDHALPTKSRHHHHHHHKRRHNHNSHRQISINKP